MRPGNVFAALSRDFLGCAARPLADGDSGRDWVAMFDALHRCGADNMMPGTPERELCMAFQEAIYQPVLSRLRAVRRPAPAEDSTSPAAARTAGHGQSSEGKALRALSKLAKALGLTHLGAFCTETALHALGVGLVSMADASYATTPDSLLSPAWTRAASEALQAFPAVGQAFGPPHQRDILAWISYDVNVHVAGLEQSASELGRIARFNAGEPPGGDLQALTLDHNRAGHAERIALLGVVEHIRRTEGQLRRRLMTSHEGSIPRAPCITVTGTVRLFAGHTPCLSCLAVFAQFAKGYPAVTLSVSFQDSRYVAAVS